MMMSASFAFEYSGKLNEDNGKDGDDIRVAFSIKKDLRKRNP